MRSRFVLAAAVLLILGGTLPAVAALPIGSFDGNPNGNAGYGVIPLTGWALDDDGVKTVHILVDGLDEGLAIYGLQRPGVTRKRPGYPDSQAPGFVFNLNTTHHINGKHKLQALVVSNSGEQRILGPVRVIVFRNAENMLAPFGDITFPQQSAELHGDCTSQTERWSVITGHALDIGSGESSTDIGVAWGELLIDGALALNTKNACVFIPSAAGLTNCANLPSPELLAAFPQVPGADLAGFRFAIDVGQLIASGQYLRGGHTLTIRAGDYGENVRNIASITVFFSCAEDIANEKSIGAIESPNTQQPFFGTFTLKGWAVDIDGIAGVLVKANGVTYGNATIGLPRPNVANLYPSYPSSASAGFSLSVNTLDFNDGVVPFEVFVTDLRGDVTRIGKVIAIIDNTDH